MRESQESGRRLWARPGAAPDRSRAVCLAGRKVLGGAVCLAGRNVACSGSGGKFRGRGGGAPPPRGALGSDLGLAVDLSISLQVCQLPAPPLSPGSPPPPRGRPVLPPASRAAVVGGASLLLPSALKGPRNMPKAGRRQRESNTTNLGSHYILL